MMKAELQYCFRDFFDVNEKSHHVLNLFAYIFWSLSLLLVVDGLQPWVLHENNVQGGA